MLKDKEATMNHRPEELFSVFFSTVFESSCISDFTRKVSSFLKRYMPVSAAYICFFEKDTLFKVAEHVNYIKTPFPDQVIIPEDILNRMYVEDNFFTGDVHSIRNFTGEGSCVFSEFRNSLFNNEESSSIYIPIKHHVLEDIHIYMSIYSIGKNRFSQEDIDICSFIQPMLIDTFNSILLYNDINALKQSFIAEKSPSVAKSIIERYDSSANGDAFPTLDAIIIEHIKLAITKANGKIAGPDGAASLLGLNTSTLWSKIRKYNIDPKTLTE